MCKIEKNLKYNDLLVKYIHHSHYEHAICTKIQRTKPFFGHFSRSRFSQIYHGGYYKKPIPSVRTDNRV